MILDRMVFLKDMICVFDIDGVLAAYEYGFKNHNICDPKNWGENEIIKTYKKARCPQTMIDFVNSRDIKKNFVCSLANSNTERFEKIKFVTHSYPNINISNIFFVENPEDKLNILYNIYARHNYMQEKIYRDQSDIFMVDDSIEILNYIQENSSFSTLHISSFLD
ncbi:MAG: hypothetical protein NC548_15655 [Lachnospiraceae bacterium]|nr:hypothetical protein [Lachnospiraceae bacterium]